MTLNWEGLDLAILGPACAAGLVVLVATVGTVIGTAFGTRVLGRIPPQVFRRIVAIMLVVLGGYMILGRGGKP